MVSTDLIHPNRASWFTRLLARLFWPVLAEWLRQRDEEIDRRMLNSLISNRES